LLCRLTGLSWPLLAAAAVFPDVIDKGLRLVGLFTTGRHVAHNLFAVIATTALVASWRGIRPGLSWLVGYIAHLLGDLPFSWDMQWFYPLEWGRWRNSVETAFMGLSLEQIAFDLGVTAAALSAWALQVRSRRARATPPDA
jgi:membrane-bound metal-dependent hydrolase YbcI (DUF457 family)